MKRAAIYARISKDAKGDQLGVKRQEDDCRQLCTQRGWEVVEVLVDNDTSAYSGARRPQWERLLDLIALEEVDAVVAWHPDRMYRRVVDLLPLIDLCEKHDVEIATVTAGHVDVSTATGRAVAKTIAVWNEHESEHKAERIRRKHRELAEAGRRVGGGTRPFGYLPDRVTLDPVEAELVRDAARRVLAGETITSICRDWNDHEISTVTGARWTPHVLRRILVAPSTAGLRSHQGVVLGRGVWAVIVDEATHTRLRAILLDPARTTNPGEARRYLLTGFLLCGRCGARMVARPVADKRRAYVCASGPGFDGCGKMKSLADPLEELVRDVIFDAVDSPELAERIRRRRDDVDDDALLAEIHADEAALEQLARDHYVERVVSRAQFVAASQELERRLVAARRRLVRSHVDLQAAGWAGRGADLRAAWDAHEDVGWRRAVVASFVERVVLGPAVRGRNYFDADRITPERLGDVVWRV